MFNFAKLRSGLEQQAADISPGVDADAVYCCLLCRSSFSSYLESQHLGG